MCTFLLETQRNSATISLFFQSAIYIVVQLSAYIICNTIDLRTHFLSIMYAKRHTEMMEGSCSKNFDFCPPLKNIYYVAQWAQNILEVTFVYSSMSLGLSLMPYPCSGKIFISNLVTDYILKREEESLASSLLNIICYQN